GRAFARLRLGVRHSGGTPGRRWARQPIVMLINNLDIRIIHATTGEVLRTLTLNPERRYQPLTPTPKRQTTEP
ncbi:MAG: IS481 family transposase, partial [Actinomycetota bacterium]